MSLLKTILFLLAGAFLGLTPVLSYYFTHGPSCPCHALIGGELNWPDPGSQSGNGETESKVSPETTAR